MGPHSGPPLDPAHTCQRMDTLALNKVVMEKDMERQLPILQGVGRSCLIVFFPHTHVSPSCTPFSLPTEDFI